MKRILYYTIFVLCAAACGQRVSQEESASTEYETMTVSRSDISLEETYPASIEGRQSIRIIPRVEGYLQDIKVKEGQRVKKGQMLFVLDQANYVADEKAARANVEVAKAGVETAQLNYDSRKGLREKNIVSEYDLQTAAAALSLAKAQLLQAQAQWEAARSNLSYTVLKSPSDGVVDRSTGALSARAVFPNPDGRLLSGSTGRLLIQHAMKQVIVIPQSATYEIQDKVYAYKVVDGKAQSVIISVLPVSDGQNYVVTDGLDEGEIIVSKGASYVKEGQQI